MATRRRHTSAYNTYGSIAYAPAYGGTASVGTGQQAQPQPRPEPSRRQRSRRQGLTRTQVQVREAGQVAPFAVIGFLAVAVFAVLLLMSYAQLTVVNGEMASLRDELSSLQSENATLTAQYEKVFDMQTIQEAVGDTMVRPTYDQVVYIDLSEPDTVVIYGEETFSGLKGALEGLGEVFGGILEYFR